MRTLRLALFATAALGTAGCFKSTTLLRVNADGSGTIEQTTLVTQAALRSLRQLAAIGDDNGKPADFFSAAQARQFADALGSNVTVVSSTRIKTSEGEGSKAIFAFRDINELQIKQRGASDAGAERTGMDAAPQVHFALTHEANGHAVLRITMPPPKVPPNTATAPEGSGASPQSRMPPEQLAMFKQMFAGMHVAIAIEPAGQLVKTSSPFVEGTKVTLVDVAFDQLLANDTAFSRLQTARTIEDVRAAMKDVPGLKVNLDPEITIEFVGER